MHTERETPDQSCHPATDRPAPRTRAAETLRRAGLSVALSDPRSASGSGKYGSQKSRCGREHLWCIDIIDYHNYAIYMSTGACRGAGCGAGSRPAHLRRVFCVDRGPGYAARARAGGRRSQHDARRVARDGPGAPPAARARNRQRACGFGVVATRRRGCSRSCATLRHG